MGDLCQTFDVYHIRVGIAQSLDVESLGVLLKACFDPVIIGRSHESGGHTVADGCRSAGYCQSCGTAL